MLNLYKFLFFSLMILGSMIAISATSWLSMWMGLEINLLSIAPLLKSHNFIYPAEATIKYFLTQALASTILMFSLIMSMTQTEIFFKDFISLTILNSALLMKLGAAPFHWWFPEVMSGLNWQSSFILLTWQKLAPIILISYNMNNNIFFTSIMIMSSLIGGLLGFNQTSLRKIMAYSSINHIAWMLASMTSIKPLWLIYFTIYSLISLNCVVMFHLFNIYFINQMYLLLNSSKLMKILFMMNFFSLGGLPPFLGFLPKWMVINSLMTSQFYLIGMILIISTLISIYFYLRLSFVSLTICMMENLTFFKFNNYFTIFFNAMNLMMLISCTLIFNFF